MKFNFTTIISRLCTVGLAILGFGCSEKAGPDDVLLMYGSPTGSWEIKGVVTDQDGKSVPDATVRVTKPDLDSGICSITETSTDAKGVYSADGHVLTNEVKVVCIPDDPTLDADSTVVALKYNKDKKDKNSWYVGHADATVDFKLKPKGENEE